jgi:DNA-binding transcriptional LysR family regulator
MSLNHRELSVFLAIARSGSINAASKVMGMTQPALSRSLKRLEDQLDANLFTRHASGMTLTPFGEALRRHAELVEFESNRVVEELKMLGGAGTGSVRVGLVPSVVGSLFQSALPHVYRASPKMQIRLVEGSGDRMIEAVARGEVDFAVVGRLNMENEPDVVATPISREEVCVAAGARHPVFRNAKVTLKQLRNYSWALPENGNAIWYGFLELFRSAGLEPPVPAISSNSVHALKSIVGHHQHLTMITRVVFALEEKHGLILPVPGTSWLRELAVVRRVRSNLMPAARLVLRELQKEASKTTVVSHSETDVSKRISHGLAG